MLVPFLKREIVRPASSRGAVGSIGRAAFVTVVSWVVLSLASRSLFSALGDAVFDAIPHGRFFTMVAYVVVANVLVTFVLLAASARLPRLQWGLWLVLVVHGFGRLVSSPLALLMGEDAPFFSVAGSFFWWYDFGLKPDRFALVTLLGALSSLAVVVLIGRSLGRGSQESPAASFALRPAFVWVLAWSELYLLAILSLDWLGRLLLMPAGLAVPDFLGIVAAALLVFLAVRWRNLLFSPSTPPWAHRTSGSS